MPHEPRCQESVQEHVNAYSRARGGEGFVSPKRPTLHPTAALRMRCDPSAQGKRIFEAKFRNSIRGQEIRYSGLPKWLISRDGLTELTWRWRSLTDDERDVYRQEGTNKGSKEVDESAVYHSSRPHHSGARARARQRTSCARQAGIGLYSSGASLHVTRPAQPARQTAHREVQDGRALQRKETSVPSPLQQTLPGTQLRAQPRAKLEQSAACVRQTENAPYIERSGLNVTQPTQFAQRTPQQEIQDGRAPHRKCTSAPLPSQEARPIAKQAAQHEVQEGRALQRKENSASPSTNQALLGTQLRAQPQAQTGQSAARVRQTENAPYIERAAQSAQRPPQDEMQEERDPQCTRQPTGRPRYGVEKSRWNPPPLRSKNRRHPGSVVGT